MHISWYNKTMKYTDLPKTRFRELYKLMQDCHFPQTPDNYDEFLKTIEKTKIIAIYEEDVLEAAVVLSSSDNVLWVDVCASDKFKGHWATKETFRRAVHEAERQGKSYFGIEAINPISHIAAKKAGFTHTKDNIYMISVKDFRKKWRV